MALQIVIFTDTCRILWPACVIHRVCCWRAL